MCKFIHELLRIAFVTFNSGECPYQCHVGDKKLPFSQESCDYGTCAADLAICTNPRNVFIFNYSTYRVDTNCDE